MTRRDKPVYIPLDFEEALAGLLRVDPEAEPEQRISRLRPQHATNDSHDLVGFPREWAENDKTYRWAFSYEVTEDVPEDQREPGYMYVPAREWDRQLGGSPS